MWYSLFATCKLHYVNLIEWLIYVSENINDHKINTIPQLLPQNYAALAEKNDGVGRGVRLRFEKKNNNNHWRIIKFYFILFI